MTASWRRPATYLAVIVVVVAVWELLTVTGLVKPILLAAPAAVGTALIALFSEPGGVVRSVGVTLAEVGVAFVIAVVVAIPIGVAVGSTELLRRAYTPLLAAVNALPLVILYPVLAATLGIGSPSKVALGALYAFFPIAISTAQATSHVDRRLITAAEVMGAGRSQVTRAVVAPAIAVPVIAGLRVSLALSLVTVIAAEFISGSDGIGYQLAASSQSLDTPTLFAWVVIACAVTVLLNVVFSIASNQLLRGIRR